MTYQEEIQIKVRRQRTRNAIELAMAGKWREAVTANQEIIEEFPGEVDAYNRLGRAYLELGVYSQAREAYRRTLEMDAANTIARKNLERLEQLGEDREVPEEETLRVEPSRFIEETGKTGTAVLERPAPPTVLARLVAGDTLDLSVEGTRLKAFTQHEGYIGQLNPLDAHRLIKLIHGGNRYHATVTSVDGGRVSVILRETYQHPSQANVLSFPPRAGSGPRPYAGDRTFRGGLDEVGYAAEPLDNSDQSGDIED